jgi:phosphoribosyl-ATP pyrophosphohydrolase
MDTLKRLEHTITQRAGASPETSYVAKLNEKGPAKIAQKLGEEAVETVIAAVSGSREEVIGESADLLFHLLVLLQNTGVSLEEVMTELERREGTSGIDEKALRGEG